MNRKKILGWSLLIPRLIVFVCASISLYCAYSAGNMFGIIAGAILTVLYLLDAIYLIVLIVHDFITNKDEPSRLENLDEKLDEALEGEQDIFNIHKKQ